jgi:hypothetical protein
VELAIDFEVAMGVDFPPEPRRPPGSEVPLSDRARGFAQLLRLVRGAAAPAPVHPGEHEERVYSLAPLGVPRSSGLTRRPVLAGGQRTEHILRQLETVCPQRIAKPAARAQVTSPAHTGWAQRFIPQHPPDRVMQWERWGGEVRSRGDLAKRRAEAKQRMKAKRTQRENAPHSPPPQRRKTSTATARVGEKRRLGEGSAEEGLEEEEGCPRSPKRVRHGRENPRARER